MLLPLSLFYTVAIFANNSTESTNNTALKSQTFIMPFNANELGDVLPISPEDLAKTTIVRPVYNSYSNKRISTIGNIIDYVGCDLFHSSIACASKYDFFEQDNESPENFFNNMKHNPKYPHHKGTRYTAPIMSPKGQKLDDQEPVTEIPCVFCANINGKDQETTHGLFLYTDNLALCKALEMHNNNIHIKPKTIEPTKLNTINKE